MPRPSPNAFGLGGANTGGRACMTWVAFNPAAASAYPCSNTSVPVTLNCGSDINGALLELRHFIGGKSIRHATFELRFKLNGVVQAAA